jgi:integrase
MHFVKSTRHQNGERFLNLLDARGVPLFWPTIWTLTDLRASGKSINTINQALTTLKVVYDFLDEYNIDLEKRLQAATFLERNELEGLYRYLKTPLRKVSKGKVVKIKKFDEVSQGSFAIRLNYTKAYFAFLIESFALKYLNDEKKRQQIALVRELVGKFFDARKPAKVKLTEPRLGLSKEEQEKLCRTISTNSSNNPWKSEFIRDRNETMVLLLLETGMRRGELLSLKTSDLNLQQKSFKIEKRVSGLVDPRAYRPLVKTLGREVMMSAILASKVSAFILNHRVHQPLAKKHPFLFTSRTGEPLSIKSVNAIFDDIKLAIPGLDIYPHALRHTFNSNLSLAFENSKVEPELEMKIRTELNGWSHNSQMPALYAKRHTKEKARQVIFDQQIKQERR